MPKEILFDNRWCGNHGIGRFSQEISKRLVPGWRGVESKSSPISPLDPLSLSFEINRRKPKLFFSPGFNVPILSSAPFIFTVHDLMHLKIPGEASFLKKQYYERLVKPAIFKAKKVLTVSEHAKQDILSWSKLKNEEKIVVVGNGVSSEFAPSGDRFYYENEDYFLYIGNRKPHKNIDVLLRAFSKSKARLHCKLLISGSKDKAIEDKLLKFNLTDAVEFLGFIEESELPNIYRGAKALVIPSLYEGFGLPALEAMACGTPVIASNRASLPEVVGDAGLLFDPESDIDLAEKIDSISSSELVVNECISKGLERSKMFTWDKTASLVNQVIKDCLD